MIKKLTTTFAALCAIASTASAEFNPEITVGGDFKNGYISEGRTFNDSVVFQPWVSVDGLKIANLPINFTVWGNYDFSEYHGVQENQFQEVDYEFTITIPNETFDINTMIRIWEYPDSDSDTDLLFGASIGKELGESGFYARLYADYCVEGNDGNGTFEPSISYNLQISEALSVGAKARAYYQTFSNNDKPDGWAAYDIGPHVQYGNISASIVYIGQIDNDVLPEGPFEYDVEYLASIGYSFTF